MDTHEIYEASGKALEIQRLKRQARRSLLAYHRAADKLQVGGAQAKYLSNTAARHAKSYNDCMKELQEIDQRCPMYSPL